MTPGSQILTIDSFMHRCIELAMRGAGLVAPNPMVGAVMVYKGRIIGEGYHQKYGEAHAEVNCLKSVKVEDRSLISKSTLYVSLEPCNFFGKTPPCTDLILKNKIPEVVIGCLDPNNKVEGKGIEVLKAKNVNVTFGVLEKECINLNKRFFTFQKQQRPYIILKWAETANGKMAPAYSGNAGNGNLPRLLISNEKTNRIVHKWRSEEASILVGTNTALQDDPELTNRLWNGPSPIRLVIDMDLKLPGSLKIFNKKVKTIIFNYRKHAENKNIFYYQIDKNKNLIQQLIQSLFLLNIQSVLVEGGARLLQSFLDENCWDEIRVIKNEKLKIDDGLDSPRIPELPAINATRICDDLVNTYIRS